LSFKKISLLSLPWRLRLASLPSLKKGRLFVRTPRPQAALEPFDGKLSIQAIDDLRVAGRKIVLCGVAFSKPRSIRAMVTEAAARRDYQGLALTCKPVGKGTPCDGNVASRFGDAIVVQCLTSDLAAKLAENGILCGQPAQAGSTYKSCLSDL
jgi:hypothetical protein